MFKKRLSIAAAVVIAFVLCVVTFVATYSHMTVVYKNSLNEQKLSQSTETEKLDYLLSLIESGYLRDYDEEQLWDTVYKALAAGLGDDYSVYMTADEYGELVSSGSGSFVGIGVHAVYDPDEEGIYLFGIIPGSPAEGAGLMKGDVIKAVDRKEINKDNYYEMLDAVRGVSGSEVTLTVLRDGRRKTVVLTRASVNSENVLYEQLNGDTAYIRILSFADTSVSEEFESVMKRAEEEGCKKYVFDVRNNGGGYLDEICAVLDYLLPEGVLINIVDKDGNTTTKDSGESHIDAPMTVLCNGSTASAAELFTKALMDYGYAESVGETTFGKGTMQVTKVLPDGSALKLSSYYYNPPCNISYDGIGITPDHSVALGEEWANRFYKMTDEDDAQLQFALSLLSD